MVLCEYYWDFLKGQRPGRLSKVRFLNSLYRQTQPVLEINWEKKSVLSCLAQAVWPSG